ncbi:MAG TPA: lysophospholipid acyltransferase family protein [Acidimicrobiia bacterium]
MAQTFKSLDPTSTPSQSRFLWRVAPPVIRGVGRTLFALRVEKEADLPPPPFIVAANHYSHFDPAVVGAVIGTPVRFLAVESLFGTNKLLDWLIIGFGSIPTPRGRHPVKAVRTALEALDAGDIVGVFPEAMRVSHWGLLPPRRGAAWLAKRAGVPIVPVTVVGTGRAFNLDNRLRPARVRVVVGRAIPPDSGDLDGLTERWARWVTSQIARYPGSESQGPQRTSIP